MSEVPRGDITALRNEAGSPDESLVAWRLLAHQQSLMPSRTIATGLSLRNVDISARLASSNSSATGCKLSAAPIASAVRRFSPVSLTVRIPIRLQHRNRCVWTEDFGAVSGLLSMPSNRRRGIAPISVAAIWTIGRNHALLE
jgi:hypothetical protein